jgi:hypothetical protein
MVLEEQAGLFERPFFAGGSQIEHDVLRRQNTRH